MLQVSAGAIFRSDGRVLLCQRGYGDCAGLWEFPGGKREPGEDACACLEREIREELNLRIRCTEVLGSVVYAYPTRTIELTLVRRGNFAGRAGADRTYRPALAARRGIPT